MNDKAEDLAYGRWPEILQSAGVSDTFFNPRRNGPCPFCGGTDRYRWSDKNAGAWLCRKCPESDGRWCSGFEMLMKHMGFTHFRDAADHVRAHFNGAAARGTSRAMVRPAVKDSLADHERNLRRMKTIWEASRAVSAGDPVDRYLKRRVPGLDFLPQLVRFHPALDYWAPPEDPQGRPVLLGKFPAMVAKAVDLNGSFVQLHKTYLTEEGLKAAVPVVKKTERGVGVNGFAVPMMPLLGDTLGFAEGIESALAGAMVRRIPVWSCLNGPSMAAFDIPEKLLDRVSRVVIFADHDELKALPTARSNGAKRLRSAGSHYAEQLAERVRARGKRVLVLKASRVGHDMADYWTQQHGEAALA